MRRQLRARQPSRSAPQPIRPAPHALKWWASTCANKSQEHESTATSLGGRPKRAGNEDRHGRPRDCDLAPARQLSHATHRLNMESDVEYSSACVATITTKSSTCAELSKTFALRVHSLPAPPPAKASAATCGEMSGLCRPIYTSPEAQ